MSIASDAWKKSSRCSANAQCVEVAPFQGVYHEAVTQGGRVVVTGS